MKKLLLLILCVTNVHVFAKNDKSYDAMTADEKLQYALIKQQAGSYLASCGSNVDEETFWQYIKQIGTPIALNVMHNSKKIHSIICKAEELASLGKYKEAIAELDSTIKIDRTNIKIWWTRGNIYFSLGNYIQSISDYTTAINIISPVPPFTGILYLKRALAFKALGSMSGFQSDCLMAGNFGNAEAQQMLTIHGWL